MNLTPQQKQAVQHIEGNLQIIACAGCDFAGIWCTRSQARLEV